MYSLIFLKKKVFVPFHDTCMFLKVLANPMAHLNIIHLNYMVYSALYN